jgi:XTP/dITP diphosphohydrolase
MQQMVLASNNTSKITELNALLAPQQWKIIAQSELSILEAEETGQTFIENALIKARHASSLANLPALADDSGIVVDALHGAPGIHSARYAGNNASDTDNNDKLLAELATFSAQQRQAYFHCTLIWIRHAADPDPIICQGRWYGSILHSPRGNHGFGYDPIFWVEQMQCSAAELNPEQKGQLSHRGIASRQLVKNLAALKHSRNNPVIAS